MSTSQTAPRTSTIIRPSSTPHPPTDFNPARVLGGASLRTSRRRYEHSHDTSNGSGGGSTTSPGSASTSLPSDHSNLCSLLFSDPDLHSRYREGRYKPGINFNLKISNYSLPISTTLRTISERCKCQPRVSESTLVNLVLHLGAATISGWDQVAELSSLLTQWLERTPEFDAAAISDVTKVVGELSPTMIIGRRRNFVVGDCTHTALGVMASGIGMSSGIAGVMACSVVLVEQPPQIVVPEFRADMVRMLNGLRSSLRTKISVLTEALKSRK